MNKADGLLTVAEVAKELKVTPFAVRSWLASGQLEGVRLGSGPKGHLRIPRAALERFVQPAPKQMTGSLRPWKADTDGMIGTIRT